MNLKTPVGQLNRVGKTLAKRLERLGIRTVFDLLFYFPFRYEDFSQVKLIKDIQDGEQVSIKGRVEIIASKRSFKKRKIITEAVVSDSSERIRVVWFGQPFIGKILKVGDEIFLSGKVKADMLGMQMISPSYEPVRLASLAQGKLPTHTARIVPMYSLTEGITQKQIRFLMSQVIDLAKDLKEWLPEEILEKADLIPLAEAIKGIHFTIDQTDLKQSARRLKFGELFIPQLRAEMVRQSLKRLEAPILEFKEQEIKELVNSLSFQLTKAQKISAWEIFKDLEKKEPMNRLLEGDVGSGKTVIAGMALYNTVLNGYQGALMAPTEILARQHFESLSKLLSGKASIGLLTRTQFSIYNLLFREPVFGPEAQTRRDGSSEPRRQFSNNLQFSNDKISKKNILKLIKDREVDIIVGTHALLSESIEFKNLGLVIVDEQHRFGVEQRKRLLEVKHSTPSPSPNKRGGVIPHFLSMTATPIPRSLALSVYGDLDLSIINEMPSDRKPIKTRLVEPHNREKAYQFIRKQVNDGRQIFVICPLIEKKTQDLRLKIIGENNQSSQSSILNLKSYVDEKKSVLSEYEKLSKHIFSDLKVSFLHGKLKSKEKEEIMKKFGNNEISILVSTSVVEVGVNIPNASVMMVEGAERFGLAQLHQFRGRVGRSSHQSYCFLFTDNDSSKVLERLKYFEKNNDGFKVAEYDLETRGPGEVYGTAQSGMMNFKLATLKDKELIKLTRDLAREIDFEKYPILKEKVKDWEERVHLE